MNSKGSMNNPNVKKKWWKAMNKIYSEKFNLTNYETAK